MRNIKWYQHPARKNKDYLSMKYVFYVDSSELFSYYHYDIAYSGNVKIYQDYQFLDPNKKADLIVSNFDPDGKHPERWVENTISEIVGEDDCLSYIEHDWNLILIILMKNYLNQIHDHSRS